MRRHRFRLATVVFCGLICAMYVVQIIIGITLHISPARTLFAPSEEVLMRAGAAYTGMPMAREWPRLITSMFVHGGLIHLAANVMALWQLGALLEELFGAKPFLLSYALGGILAGAISIAGPGARPGILYVGASGAIFAIAGTLLIGLRRVSKLEGGQWSHGLSSRLLGCLGANLVLGLGVSAVASWANLGFAIAVGAHVAGLIAGAVTGLAMPMTLRDTPLTRRLMGIGPTIQGQSARPPEKSGGL